MRVLSVVGNRPQFIKSAPLSLALRERRNRRGRAPHRPALGRGALGDLLRRARPLRAALPARPADGRRRRDGARDPRRRRGRASRLGARLRRHQLDPGRRARRGRDPASPTSRRACAASTSRCPRSETASRSTRSRRCSSAPTSARPEQLALEGVGGPARRGRRRDGGRRPPVRAARPRALTDPRHARPRAGLLRGGDRPPRGQRDASRSGSAASSKDCCASTGRSSSRRTRARGRRSKRSVSRSR